MTGKFKDCFVCYTYQVEMLSSKLISIGENDKLFTAHVRVRFLLNSHLVFLIKIFSISCYFNLISFKMLKLQAEEGNKKNSARLMNNFE